MHLAGGLGSLLKMRCSRTPIIVNIIGEDDSSNEIHLKRLRSVYCYLQPKYSVARSGETSLGRPRLEQNSAMIPLAKMDGRMDTRGTGGSWGGNL